jgi:GT2 family glycosyltransferase
MITAVIPAYNEYERISAVIAAVIPFVDEVLVVDDGSTDNTGTAAKKAGATVHFQGHQGYIAALKCGIQSARGDIIVTLDADGEHDPSDIPRLAALIVEGKADVVLGCRQCIPLSERIIGSMVRLKIPVTDHGTGFRAMTKGLAQTLELRGKCTCGVLVLEAASKGATIAEVPITVQKIHKKRRRKWVHLIQVVYVLYQIIRMSAT